VTDTALVAELCRGPSDDLGMALLGMRATLPAVAMGFGLGLGVIRA
jgi:hypothetical protein